MPSSASGERLGRQHGVATPLGEGTDAVFGIRGEAYVTMHLVCIFSVSSRYLLYNFFTYEVRMQSHHTNFAAESRREPPRAAESCRLSQRHNSQQPSSHANRCSFHFVCSLAAALFVLGSLHVQAQLPA